MQFVAFGLFALAAVVLVWILVLPGPDDLGVAQTIRRVAFGLVLLTPAYLAAQWSGSHRKREAKYRSMELEFASMDPYLALLPPDLRQAVKTELAGRYFRGNDPEAEALNVGTWVDLIRRSKTDESDADDE